MWFSACELGVFLTTGTRCIKTEPNIKVFSGKGIAMMHECKRLLNHSTAAEGLLLARGSTQRPKAISMDAFLVPQPADTDGDAGIDATEGPGSEQDEDSDATERVQDGNATERAKDGDATEHARGASTTATTESPRKKQRVREEQPGDATERADYSEDECDEALPPCITSNEAAATVADATGKKQMFTKSLKHRDDWLHRGIMLRDMDYYHYSRYVERVEMPRSGSAQSFQKHHGVYYLFDVHYPLAKTYVQILLKKTMQAIRC